MTSTKPNQNINEGREDQFSCKLVSEIIRARIQSDKARFHANDNISEYIFPGELETPEKEVAVRVDELLKTLLIDIDNDHNTQETAERVSRMYINEVFKGRYHKQPNNKRNNESATKDFNATFRSRRFRKRRWARKQKRGCGVEV